MDTIEQLKDLYRHSFDDSQSYLDYFFRHKYDGSNAVTVERDGRIVSALYLLDKTLRLGENDVSCAFISAAATLPELRGRGILVETMWRAFEKAQRDGKIVAALHPFRHSYYERYGFVTYTYVKPCVLDFERRPAGYTVETVGKEHSAELAHIYIGCCRELSGWPVRGEAEQKERLAEFFADGETAYLVKNACGEPVCYALADAADGASCEEFCCKDDGVLKAFAAPAGMTCRVPCAFDEPGAEPFGMIRALDIVKLLEKSCYQKVTDRIRLLVVDGFRPDNNRCLELSLFEGKVDVHDTESYDHSIRVEDLTLAALGVLPDRIAYLGRFFRKKVDFLPDKC